MNHDISIRNIVRVIKKRSVFACIAFLLLNIFICAVLFIVPQFSVLPAPVYSSKLIISPYTVATHFFNFNLSDIIKHKALDYRGIKNFIFQNDDLRSDDNVQYLLSSIDVWNSYFRVNASKDRTGLVIVLNYYDKEIAEKVLDNVNNFIIDSIFSTVKNQAADYITSFRQSIIDFSTLAEEHLSGSPAQRDAYMNQLSLYNDIMIQLMNIYNEPDSPYGFYITSNLMANNTLVFYISLLVIGLVIIICIIVAVERKEFLE